MFGLIAARQGLAAALPADRIALDLDDRELERIGRVREAAGLPVDPEPRLHAHLAAVATLSEGLSEDDAHAMIARESLALHPSTGEGATGPARAALHAALPGEAGGIAPILPDLLGEAVAIRAFLRLSDGGVSAVRRASEAKRAQPTASVIRACQDFLVRGHRAPLAWLEALRADATELDTLMALSNGMPTATTELREIAAELRQEILDRVRDLPAEDAAPLVAASLNNLSNRLSDLGRREDALAAGEEAVEIRRRLAAARPDAFPDPLATALWVLSGRLADSGADDDAERTHRAALTTLAPLFQRHPAALAPKIAAMAKDYFERCQRTGQTPDEATLAPILAVIQDTLGEQGE